MASFFLFAKTESRSFLNFENYLHEDKILLDGNPSFEFFSISKMRKYLENNKNNKAVDTLRINREKMLSYLDSELKNYYFTSF